jgi:hypothetical protein
MPMAAEVEEQVKEPLPLLKAAVVVDILLTEL